MAAAQQAASKQAPARKLRIAFIHPDLGIGGAERLVVDLAVGLQKQGHEVVIYTSHHDPKHSFTATNDGTLKVMHMRTIFPRSIARALHIPLAIARQNSLVFQLLASILLYSFPSIIPQRLHQSVSCAPPTEPFDVFFVDQLSAAVPWLKMLARTRTVFYCHYPDKEVSNSIAKERAIAKGHKAPSFLRGLYRLPFDFYEEFTMAYSDKILVNSSFTSRQFQASFPRMHRMPQVVYPGIESEAYQPARVYANLTTLEGELGTLTSVQKATRKAVESIDRPLFVSINRFEAKKNIALALEAFAKVRHEALARGERLRLIVAGGYDRRVRDNVSTLEALQDLSASLLLPHVTMSYHAVPMEPPASAPAAEHFAGAAVVFLPSLPAPLLYTLLLNPSVRGLLYTPTDEHFGIVPLEAMVCGVPVLATDSGGPTESVVDADVGAETATGFLRPPQPDTWAEAIRAILALETTQRERLAENAKRRVRERFSLEQMTAGVEGACAEAVALGPVRGSEGLYQWLAAILFLLILLIAVLAAFPPSSP